MTVAISSRTRVRATLLTVLALVLAGTIGARPAQAAGPNSPPVAVNDVASTPTDTVVSIDVLANDSDPDGDTLSIDPAPYPESTSNGVVDLDVATGRLLYTPNDGFVGPDSFTYDVTDGTATSTATVTVNVGFHSNFALGFTVDNPGQISRSAVLGMPTTYGLYAQNGSSFPAHDVTMTNSVPSNFVVTSVGDPHCSVTGNDITCTWPVVDPYDPAINNSVGTTVDLMPVTPGLFTNSVSVTSLEDDPANPPAPEQYSSSVYQSAGTADLGALGDGPPPASGVGDHVVMTFNGQNYGPSAATNAVLTDTVPANFRIDSISNTTDCAFAGNTVTCQRASLSGFFDTAVFLTAVLPGSWSSIATITSATPEATPEYAANTWSSSGTVSGLAFTSADSATFAAGTPGTFAVTAAGQGPPALSATGALPPGVTFVDNGDGSATLAGTPATGSGGAYPLTITARNGIDPDATQSFTLTVAVGTIGPPDAPAAPVGTAGDGQVSVAFVRPAEHGAVITGYTVTATDLTDSSRGGQHADGAQSPIVVGGLTDTDSYTFTVVAHSDAGDSPSSPASAPVVPVGPPDAPAAPVASSGDGVATVAFAPPATHGAPVTGYTVTAVDLSTPANGGETADGSGSPITVLGLTNGDTYTFTVVAHSGAGDSPASPASDPISLPPDRGVPGAPVLATPTAGDRSVSLSWTAPASDGGSAVTGYQVLQGTSAGGENATPINAAPLSGTRFTATGLANGTTYFFTVLAVNAVGSGPASNEVSARPTAPPPQGQAPNLSVAATGPRSVTLSWTPAALSNGSPVGAWAVFRGTSAGGESASPIQTVIPDPRSHTMVFRSTLSGLTGGVTYFFRVAAQGPGPVFGPASNEVSAAPGAPPLGGVFAPTVSVAATGPTSVTLSWTAPANSAVPSPVWKVFAGTSAGGESATPLSAGVTRGGGPGPGPSATVSGLTPGVTYFFRVAAQGPGPTYGPASNEVSAAPGLP